MCVTLYNTKPHVPIIELHLTILYFLGWEASSGRTSISARGSEMLLSCPSRRMWNRPKKRATRDFLCWRVLRLLSNSWPSTRSTFSIAEPLSKKWWSESKRRIQRVMRASYQILDRCLTYPDLLCMDHAIGYRLYTWSFRKFII